MARFRLGRPAPRTARKRPPVNGAQPGVAATWPGSLPGSNRGGLDGSNVPEVTSIEIQPSGDLVDPSTAYRLPRTLIPRHYRLHLDPDLQRATFAGEVVIAVEVKEQTAVVELHCVELEISAAEISLESPAGKPRVVEITSDASQERIKLHLDKALPIGPAELRLVFTGILNDRLHGFYRSKYLDQSGEERTIATTQFEATDARRAFPCFDEPDLKAVFSISLDVSNELLAVSNSPIAEETDLGGGRRRVRFADTIAMSTYLVAFVVGPLVATEPRNVNGVTLRVVHAPGKEDLTAFALEAGAHALSFFTNWFDIAYPGQKLDLVAIPDFAFGAMENLGCVTFRESALLVDPSRASRLEVERVADVVSHEIAHMWFGDLVTMKWWNGLWLNEAFATYMELACVDDLRPEWRRWVSFGLEREAAMSVDGLKATRPVEFPVGPPEEAQGMFDVLTYQKGASVLRMIEQYLGLERFQSGIRAYLDGHRFGNAETTDLWDAIEDSVARSAKLDGSEPEPVRAIMDSWIFQGGYPLVTVSAGNSGEIRLAQAPFCYSGSIAPQGAGSDVADGKNLPRTSAGASGSPEPKAGPGDQSSSIGHSWLIPVLVRTIAADGNSQHARTLLSDPAGTLQAGGDASKRLAVVVNANGTGFYRVRYERDLLEKLTGALEQLSPLERFGLVADTWASVLAGSSELADIVSLAGRLGPENDPNVWSIVSSVLAMLDRVAPDERSRDSVKAAALQLFSPVLQRLGWQAVVGEPEELPKLRSLAITTLGALAEDPQVRATAEELHRGFLQGESLDPDLAAAVVSVVASVGGHDSYETFLSRYLSPQTPQEEMRYLYGLAGFTEPELLERTLELCITQVRTQNAPFLLSQLLGQRKASRATWEFIEEHWDDLIERFPDSTIPRMLEGAKSLCCPDDLATQVREFLGSHPVRTGQKTVSQVLERLEVNVAFAKRVAPVLYTTLAGGMDRPKATR